MDIFERANEWVNGDPDEAAKQELTALITRARTDEASKKDLTERFVGPLEFGTAGLRGVLGAGESRMNRAVVRRTSFGLGNYLLAHVPDVKKSGVVVGYDGRRLSREFSEDTAAVLTQMGIPVHLATHVVPTPVTAFAVTKTGAAAGVMVTASHNPPEYNGYKVYWGNGAQIIPPHDTGIAAEIAKAPRATDVPLRSLDDARKAGLLHDLPPSLEEAYLDGVSALAIHPRAGDRAAPIVYTALHGVGNRLVLEVMARNGFTSVHSVAEQAEPDGEFPTVAFPNPEEKGALDLAYALVEKTGADIVIANDPDVDRLAIALRSPSGKMVQLTGNQVGVLLGHYVLTEGDASGDRCALASCVSSPQLGVVARALGAHYEETLTGFKWIANRAMELEQSQRKRFVFGYEEALGYTVGDLVRDKDGISAALLFAELWAVRRAAGQTIWNELETIARRYGAFVSGQLSVTMKGADGLAKIKAIMDALRASPPATIGGIAVVSHADVKTGKGTKNGAPFTVALPSSDVLIDELEDGSRVIARPSGTEPKIKIYFDVCEKVADGEALAAAEARAAAKLEVLKKDFARIAGV